jgi:hypothetical protein
VSVFAIAYGAAQQLLWPLGDRVGKFHALLATLACSIGTEMPWRWPPEHKDMLVFARLLMALGGLPR